MKSSGKIFGVGKEGGDYALVRAKKEGIIFDRGKKRADTTLLFK